MNVRQAYEWVDGLMDGLQRDGWINGWIERQTLVDEMDERMNGWIYLWMD
jgi:hypothetical protein